MLKLRNSTEKEFKFYLDIITCDPSIYTIDHLLYYTRRMNPLVHKGLNETLLPSYRLLQVQGLSSCKFPYNFVNCYKVAIVCFILNKILIYIYYMYTCFQAN